MSCMIRFLLAALMCCLYVHAFMSGFKIGTRTRREGKVVHLTVPGKDILKCMLVLGCGMITAFTIRL